MRKRFNDFLDALSVPLNQVVLIKAQKKIQSLECGLNNQDLRVQSVIMDRTDPEDMSIFRKNQMHYLGVIIKIATASGFRFESKGRNIAYRTFFWSKIKVVRHGLNFDSLLFSDKNNNNYYLLLETCNDSAYYTIWVKGNHEDLPTNNFTGTNFSFSIDNGLITIHDDSVSLRGLPLELTAKLY